MLLVIPISRSDIGLIPTVEKAFELFPPGDGHDLLVVGTPNVKEHVEKLYVSLSYKHFNSSNAHIFESDNHMGWPVACNYYFQQVCIYLIDTIKPFLWFELDCTPLKKDWLNRIEDDYYKDHDQAHYEKREPNIFMGKKEQTYVGQNGSLVNLNEAGMHMAPCGVYPGDCWERVIPLKGIDQNTVPWYIHCQWYINIRLNDSPLFQNNWRTFGYRREGDRIVCDSDANLAWGVHFNDDVSKEAVLLHGCKDGSLCEALTGQVETPELNIAPVELIELRRKRRKQRLARQLVAA
jgi:hypothetical protein